MKKWLIRLFTLSLALSLFLAGCVRTEEKEVTGEKLDFTVVPPEEIPDELKSILIDLLFFYDFFQHFCSLLIISTSDFCTVWQYHIMASHPESSAVILTSRISAIPSVLSKDTDRRSG